MWHASPICVIIQLCLSPHVCDLVKMMLAKYSFTLIFVYSRILDRLAIYDGLSVNKTDVRVRSIIKEIELFCIHC